MITMNKDAKVKYTIKAKSSSEFFDDKEVVLHFTFEEIEWISDFENEILEKLEDSFTGGECNCNCINESSMHCECDPMVESYEILSREVANDNNIS